MVSSVDVCTAVYDTGGNVVRTLVSQGIFGVTCVGTDGGAFFLTGIQVRGPLVDNVLLNVVSCLVNIFGLLLSVVATC